MSETPTPTREPFGEYWIAFEIRLSTAVVEQGLVAEDLGSGIPTADDEHLVRFGGHPVLVDRARDDVVDVDAVGLGERVGGLQSRQLDDLLRDARQPLRLLGEPLREPLHLLGLLRRAHERLGEQRRPRRSAS